jgi:hypothetical protein
MKNESKSTQEELFNTYETEIEELKETMNDNRQNIKVFNKILEAKGITPENKKVYEEDLEKAGFLAERLQRQITEVQEKKHQLETDMFNRTNSVKGNKIQFGTMLVAVAAAVAAWWPIWFPTKTVTGN